VNYSVNYSLCPAFKYSINFFWWYRHEWCCWWCRCWLYRLCL